MERAQERIEDNIIIVRGGGDIATGTIHKLFQCGFHVLVLEVSKPTAIRRQVAFSEAVYEGTACVEGVVCKKVDTIEEVLQCFKTGIIPLLIDETCQCLKEIKPIAVIDAILAKRNLGTKKSMASITIGLGPGFVAGEDVDMVIETKRGHNLGCIIRCGSAEKNTGVPGVIAGYGKERVIHACVDGIMENKKEIGDFVTEGEVIATIGDEKVIATITGILRGIIRNGFSVKKGLKIADIDPRQEERQNCATISDKARCIAGGVLEALLYSLHTKRDCK